VLVSDIMEQESSPERTPRKRKLLSTGEIVNNYKEDLANAISKESSFKCQKRDDNRLIIEIPDEHIKYAYIISQPNSESYLITDPNCSYLRDLYHVHYPNIPYMDDICNQSIMSSDNFRTEIVINNIKDTSNVSVFEEDYNKIINNQQYNNILIKRVNKPDFGSVVLEITAKIYRFPSLSLSVQLLNYDKNAPKYNWVSSKIEPAILYSYENQLLRQKQQKQLCSITPFIHAYFETLKTFIEKYLSPTNSIYNS